MAADDILWPPAEERALLGRFYLAEVFSEVLNVIYPFQFVYLYLAMERAEWAVMPLFALSVTVLVMEVPTGVLADRWGRKPSVIIGGVLTALGWALVPLSVSLTGQGQLLGGCGAFALAGIGMTMVSGAQEAWVVDNLVAAGRADLVDRYFARAHSFASLGGVAAGVLALAILLSLSVDRVLLDSLWYIAALGLLLAAGVGITVPEHRPTLDEGPGPDTAGDLVHRSWSGLRTLVRIRPLFYLSIAIVVATFSGSAIDEAFDMSLVTKGLDARALAPFSILDDLIGMLAPLASIVIARRLGSTPVLALLPALSAIAVCFLFVQTALWLVIVLMILLQIFDCLWEPVADARLHALIPSRYRATVGSAVNQLGELANLAGLGVFALLLGQHSELLSGLVPDLVEAFSGGVAQPVAVPAPLWGLPLPDLAILIFVLSGLVAVPYVLRSGAGQQGSAVAEHPPGRGRD